MPEQIAEDMTDKELAEGMEDALEDERERVERNLDDEGAEDDDPEDEGPGAGPDDDDDLDDEDDDEDLDDDEDFDDDDEPASATESPLPEGYTRDKNGDVHRADGTMASKEEIAKFAKAAPAAAEKPADKPDAVATDKPAGEKPAEAAAAAAPKWEPYIVRADKREHQIPEAVGIQRAKGHVFIAVPEDKFDAYNRRIGLGLVAQRMTRELDERLRGVQQVEKEMRERQENPEPTETTIEADIWLKALKGEGPYAAWIDAGEAPKIKELFEPWQLEILERDVKIALNDAKSAHAAKATERRQQEEQSTADAKAWDGGLSDAIDKIAQEQAEWDGLPIDQLRELYAELRPMAKSVLGTDAEGMFVTDHGAKMIRRLLAAAASGKPTPATSTDPKPDAATAGDRHDRFNEAVNTGGKQPPSTSVKDRRDTRDRSREERRGNREGRRNKRRRDNRTPEQRAEDAARRQTRSWLSSPTLDMPD